MDRICVSSVRGEAKSLAVFLGPGFLSLGRKAQDFRNGRDDPISSPKCVTCVGREMTSKTKVRIVRLVERATLVGIFLGIVTAGVMYIAGGPQDFGAIALGAIGTGSLVMIVLRALTMDGLEEVGHR